MFGFGKKKDEPEKKPEIPEEPEAKAEPEEKPEVIEKTVDNGMNIPLKVKIEPMKPDEAAKQAPKAVPQQIQLKELTADELSPVMKALRENLTKIGMPNVKTIGGAGLSITLINVKGKSDNRYVLQFVEEPNKSLTVQTMGFCSAPAEKRTAILEAVNEQNSRLRYGAFVLNKANKVEYRVSVPQKSENQADIALEFLARIGAITDTAYPEFMKVIWN